MVTPAQTQVTARPADSHSPRQGRSVRRWAAAAGAASSPSSSSAPMTWVASAAVAPTRARKSGPSRRTGTPVAAATAGSRVANSSGRPISSSSAVSPTAMRAAVAAAPALRPKMLPNRTVTLAVLLVGAGVGGVVGEEEHAEPEHPGEDGADRDVVGGAAAAEQAEAEPDGDGGREQSQAGVDAGGEGGEGAGVGDVAERVAGEDLPAQHHEVAGQPADRGDGGAGDQRVHDEGVAEHVRQPADRVVSAGS